MMQPFTPGDATELPARALIDQSPVPIVVTNPHLDDHPIIFVNQAFERLTGYSSAEAVGRNCRFLQGEGTDKSAVARFRRAIAAGEEAIVVLQNYRAGGEAFWNEVQTAPIRDDSGEVRLFLGFQREVPPPDGRSQEAPDLMLREIQHRVKNHLQMVVSLIRLQSRKAGMDSDDYRDLARRIESLQLLYEQLNTTGGEGRTVDLGAYASQIVAAMTHLNARAGVRINVDAAPCIVSVDLAVHLGLILSELVTNALQHAFEGRDSGLVEVTLQPLNDNNMRLRVSDDGVGLPPDVGWPHAMGLGSQLITGMIESAKARLSIDRGALGTTFTVDFQRDA